MLPVVAFDRLSLSVGSWLTGVPVPQIGTSFRSLLPDGYWEYIGKPGSGAGVTKPGSFAADWDSNLLSI